MEFPGLIYGMSTRADGSMGAFSRPQRTAEEEERRRAFFCKEDIVLPRTVSARLEHGNTVSVVDDRHAGAFVPSTDALITNTRGLVLAITVADCFPVWFVDPKGGAIGIAHAGWRGVASGVVMGTVMRMVGMLRANPSRMRVCIGPGIRTCHFEVREDIVPNFAGWPHHIVRRDGKIFVNLVGVLQQQLLDVDVSPDHVEVDPACTFCDADRFFSYRRDKPAQLETMVAFIGLRQ